jgi:hypothetical protein
MPAARDSVLYGPTFRDGAMTDSDEINEVSSRNWPEVRSAPLITGGSLVAVGGLIALAGVIVGGLHLIAATRQWISEMEVPPSELARVKWAQARAAASAGVGAWQNGTRAVVVEAPGVVEVPEA